MRITTAAILALTVLLASTTRGGVAATPPVSAPTAVERSPSASPTPSPALEQSQTVPSPSVATQPFEHPDTRQIIRIHITNDGTAEWTIESRFLVTNDSEADRFNQYADAVVEGRTDAPFSPQLFHSSVDSASESTGREMSIRNASWGSSRIERLETVNSGSNTNDDVRVGIISYSFTWVNFATVENDRIYAGDALQTDDGPLFQTLSNGQRLVIEPPDNSYGFVNAPTGTENGALVWNGPHQFDSDGLEITIRAGNNSGSSSAAVLIVALLGLGTVIAGGYLLARRKGVEFPSPSNRFPSIGLPTWLGGRKNASDAHGRSTAEGDDGSEAVTSRAADSSQSRTTGTEGGTQLEFEEQVADDIDPELLSDEERVLRLLERNGGRMKQATIVSETGWSNAKVSQLLSKMDDDDDIEKLRIGRENLITLPGVDPTETN